MKHSTKVLIIGGGIVGLTSAIRLGSRGISCIVLEKKNLGYWKQGARYFAVAQDVVQWLSYRGIVDLENFWTIQDAAIRMNGFTEEVRCSSREMGLSRLGVMVKESVLMEMLIKNLENYSCISVVFSSRLEKIWNDDRCVYVTTAEGACYEGKFCIAADGKTSWVRSQLNRKTWNYDFKQIASSGVVRFDGEMHTVWDVFFKDQCVGILPFSCNQAACILMGSSRKMISYQKDDFFSILNQNLHGKMNILGIERWDGHYTLTAGRCREETFELVLFLGDALEWMHPLMGQGMNLALRHASKWLDALPESLNSGICLKRWLYGHRQQNWKAGLGVNIGAIALQSKLQFYVWKGLCWGMFFPELFKWCLEKIYINNK
ncbi:FAD-dependent oxidoreductase [Holospora undulata]|uniref:2-octaprenylphenol hydroxylase n=1 Tax=Holospora undulata HU1 TaxID=1321371 RepID=A0A061JI30_9PROT|nr:NAD(P)/FAD-dependent oxidoreductase [Holospora undulata]ETZ04639.1 2-octaprenylphenol hydroxylase [Holospora undulata HU1]